MRLRQRYKEQTCNRWHIVWEDLDTRASFVYVGEKLNPREATKRLKRYLAQNTFIPGQPHWVWKRLEAVDAN